MLVTDRKMQPRGLKCGMAALMTSLRPLLDFANVSQQLGSHFPTVVSPQKSGATAIAALWFYSYCQCIHCLPVFHLLSFPLSIEFCEEIYSSHHGKPQPARAFLPEASLHFLCTVFAIPSPPPPPSCSPQLIYASTQESLLSLIMSMQWPTRYSLVLLGFRNSPAISS